MSQVLYLSRDAEGTNFEGQGFAQHRTVDARPDGDRAGDDGSGAAVGAGTRRPSSTANWEPCAPGKTDSDFAAECATWDDPQAT